MVPVPVLRREWLGSTCVGVARRCGLKGVLGCLCLARMMMYWGWMGMTVEIMRGEEIG